MMPSDICASLHILSRHDHKRFSGDCSQKYLHPDHADPPDVPLLWLLFAPSPQLPSWMHYTAAILISSVWQFISAHW